MGAKRKVVVVDADVIVARADLGDVHHKKVVDLEEKIVNSNAQVIYPRTAIIEAVTVIQRVVGGKKIADMVADTFVGVINEVVDIDGGVYSQAVKIFKDVRSKKDTLFDCVVVAMAKKYKADAVFSFDKFYRKAGLKLVSDLKW